MGSVYDPKIYVPITKAKFTVANQPIFLGSWSRHRVQPTMESNFHLLAQNGGGVEQLLNFGQQRKMKTNIFLVFIE